MIINCVAYENGRKLAHIDVESISDWLARPDAFVWVALQDPAEEELLQMQEEFGLHDLAVEDARKGLQRPKIEEYGDTLFVVMHLVEPTGSDLQVGELAVFVGHNFVLSVRSRSAQGFLGVRQRCEREPLLLRLGAGFVFYALMDAVVDRYFPLIDAFELELEAIEEQIFQRGASRGNIERLYDLKRRTTVLRHAVGPLLEVAGKLAKYSDNGSTLSAVNFPEVSLPLHGGRRLLHIHENRPGVLTAINQIFAAQGINIAAQYLQTTPQMGYVVIDIEAEEDVAQSALQAMKAIPGTIRARLLF